MNPTTNASSTTPLVAGGATTHQGSVSPWANGRHGLKEITYFSTPSRSNKDNNNVPGICRASPKSPMNILAKKHTVEHGGTGFTRPVAVCFALNYVVGTGFLVLPYVFVQAGIVLSIITVILSSIASDMAKDYVLVSMARAEYYLENENEKQSQGSNNNNKSDLEKANANNNNGECCPCKPNVNDCSRRLTQSERDSLLDLLVPKKPKIIDRYQSLGEDIKEDDDSENRRVLLIPPVKEGPSYYQNYQNGNINNKQQNGNGNNGKLIVKDRTIELSSLSDIFLGKSGLIIYTFFLSIYMYMMLWAYTSVFAQAMATSLPLPLTYNMPNLDNYTFYAIIFGLIVCPISLMEVEDQVIMQITLTILRVLRLLIMILSAAFCPHCFQQGNDEDLEEEAAEPEQAIPLWRFQGIYILLPVVIAANLMHEALPDLSHPVQDKRTLGQTFQWTFICTGIIYSILGTAVGYCFGSSVEPSANINWEAFHSPTGYNDWIYKAIGYFVVISPALDVISAYPLNAIALGNNLMEVPWCSCFGGSGGDSTKSDDDNESSALQKHKEPSYAIRMMFRMISAIPPMIGALFVRDLGIITDYAGTAGLAVTFCITSAFFIASANYVDLSTKKTYYDSYATTHTLAWSLLVFGVGIVVFVLYQLATEDERN